MAALADMVAKVVKEQTGRKRFAAAAAESVVAPLVVQAEREERGEVPEVLDFPSMARRRELLRKPTHSSPTSPMVEAVEPVSWEEKVGRAELVGQAAKDLYLQTTRMAAVREVAAARQIQVRAGQEVLVGPARAEQSLSVKAWSRWSTTNSWPETRLSVDKVGMVALLVRQVSQGTVARLEPEARREDTVVMSPTQGAAARRGMTINREREEVAAVRPAAAQSRSNSLEVTRRIWRSMAAPLPAISPKAATVARVRMALPERKEAMAPPEGSGLLEAAVVTAAMPLRLVVEAAVRAALHSAEASMSSQARSSLMAPR
jgi:hypothetical protein